MERRDFFRSLIAGGATVAERPERRNQRAHHQNEVIYRGPMAVPERIAGIIADHPTIKRTTHRHLVSRYAGDADGWVWVFRCAIPAHRLMGGEIVRTPEGRIRVHCWRAAAPERYASRREPAEIIAAKEAPPIQPPAVRPAGLILPPLLSPAISPEWEFEEYVDPTYVERLTR